MSLRNRVTVACSGITAVLELPLVLPRSEYTRKTALTAADRATGQNEYTQEEYQNFLRLVFLIGSGKSLSYWLIQSDSI